MDNIDPKIADIVKALAYTENGGKPSQPKAGKTGEMKSIFQYTPDTWKIYSKQVSGKDGLPLNTENESAVTYAKVSGWYQNLKSEGVSDNEIPLKIASMWNAGEHKPDAYKQNWKGTNKKYGVAYDTPAYAKKVADYVKQFKKEQPDVAESGSPVAMSSPATTPGIIPNQPPSTQKNTGLIPPAMKEARQV